MSEYDDYPEGDEHVGFCSACLTEIMAHEAAHEPGEVIGCPRCRCGLLLIIDRAERNRRIDATKSAWDLAVRDGLIAQPRPQ